MGDDGGFGMGDGRDKAWETREVLGWERQGVGEEGGFGMGETRCGRRWWFLDGRDKVWEKMRRSRLFRFRLEICGCFCRRSFEMK